MYRSSPFRSTFNTGMSDGGDVGYGAGPDVVARPEGGPRGVGGPGAGPLPLGRAGGPGGRAAPGAGPEGRKTKKYIMRIRGVPITT